ncbi:MAG TPA: Fe-only nitrogenase subunit delta [Patescibacteria group bacterium]|nr:Fe-only nitrogenase subunit delta [Patescibacteria group bacterium]
MDKSIKEQIEPMVDYIMKNCLWQFHSRSWDREKQNAGILGKTTQLLCGEPVEKEDPVDKCYWVEAICLMEAFHSRCPWLATMDKGEIRELMQSLKDRIDFLTITGSLNEELSDPHY